MAGSHDAVLAIDLINPFDFPGATSLLREVRKIAPNVCRVLRRARRSEVPVIYCNDNFGQWRSDFHRNVDLCAGEDGVGAAVVREMAPSAIDYFVLKPRHSAFFETPLRMLLDQLRIERLVLVGIAADSCVLHTALDAHTLEYEVAVVGDAVAAQSSARTSRALALLRAGCEARVITTRSALRWMGP